MRNGFLLVLLIISSGCSHDPQFEPTHRGWGRDLVEGQPTADEAAAADRSAAEAWRAQQQRLINSGDLTPK